MCRMNIAIIPARGGSKRIPNKNINEFCGKPIIAWSIEAAIKTKLFDKVIVSTDSKKIAKIAKEYGAEIPFFRPKNLSDDHTETAEVVKHAIQWMNSRSFEIKFVCCIYAPAPFVKAIDLNIAYKKLVNSKKSFVFSVTSFAHPVQRSLYINQAGEINAMSPEYNRIRSQDLERGYHDAGQFYWGRSEAFLENREIFSSESLPLFIPRYRVCDIDEPNDWLYAELMFEALINAGEITV